MSRHVLCIQVKFLRKNETDSICLTGTFPEEMFTQIAANIKVYSHTYSQPL